MKGIREDNKCLSYQKRRYIFILYPPIRTFTFGAIIGFPLRDKSSRGVVINVVINTYVTKIVNRVSVITSCSTAKLNRTKATNPFVLRTMAKGIDSRQGNPTTFPAISVATNLDIHPAITIAIVIPITAPDVNKRKSVRSPDMVKNTGRSIPITISMRGGK